MSNFNPDPMNFQAGLHNPGSQMPVNDLWNKGAQTSGIDVPVPTSTHALSVPLSQGFVIIPYNFVHSKPGAGNITTEFGEHFIFKYSNERNPAMKALQDLFIITHQRPRKDGKDKNGNNTTLIRDQYGGQKLSYDQIYGPQQYRETIIPLTLPILNWSLAIYCEYWAPANVSEYEQSFLTQLGIPPLREVLDLISPLGVCITQDFGPKLRAASSADVRNVMISGETDCLNYWGYTGPNKEPRDIKELTDLYFIIKLHDTMKNKPEKKSVFDLGSNINNQVIRHGQFKPNLTQLPQALQGAINNNRAFLENNAANYKRYVWRVEPWVPEGVGVLYRSPNAQEDLLTIVKLNLPDDTGNYQEVEYDVYGTGWRIGKLSENFGSGLQDPLNFVTKENILYSVPECNNLPKKGIKLDFVSPVVLSPE